MHALDKQSVSTPVAKALQVGKAAKCWVHPCLLQERQFFTQSAVFETSGVKYCRLGKRLSLMEQSWVYPAFGSFTLTVGDQKHNTSCDAYSNALTDECNIPTSQKTHLLVVVRLLSCFKEELSLHKPAAAATNLHYHACTQPLNCHGHNQQLTSACRGMPVYQT